MNTIDKTLLSGSMGTMLLKLLSEKDMYGYEMIETLSKRSQNVFELKVGTLYPLLHSLESKKYLVSYEKVESGKMRKYYSITGEGKKFLKSKLEEWDTYADVAEIAGDRKMARAVGNALHKNPDPSMIPCHRVVNSKGELAGEYAFGGAWKQAQILESEGVEVKYRIKLRCV